MFVAVMFGRFFERGFSGMEVGRIRNVNVFLLGTGFMLVFAAFQVGELCFFQSTSYNTFLCC